jgi:hypothetical protein
MHMRQGTELYGGPGFEEPPLGKARSVGRSFWRDDAQRLTCKRCVVDWPRLAPPRGRVWARLDGALKYCCTVD